MKKTLLCVLLIIAVVFVASCGTSDRIVGTWKAQSSVLGVVTETTFVFNDDGSGSMGTAFDIAVPMTYDVNGSAVVITTSLFGIEKAINYRVAFEADTMILTNLDDANEVLTFTKEK